MTVKAYRGTVLYSEDKDRIRCIEGGYILVENGWVLEVSAELPEKYRSIEVIDWGKNLLIPGFCDMHVHASQFLQRGLGMDRELLEWLDVYTFPGEARFADPDYAKKVYSLFAEELLRQGTLHVNCFSTIHMPASEILYDVLKEKGIFAFCGKINMDQNSPDYYCEETAQSIRETKAFLDSHPADDQMTPAIIPRFTVTCSEQLLKGLGALTEGRQVVVHSHMCEAIGEMDTVRQLFPQYKNGGEIFFKNGLLGTVPTVMAHCIFMDEDVLELMKNPNCMAVHCPDATANINAGGIMPVKKLLQEGIALGLGSDVGSGAKLSIAHVMAAAIQHSKIRQMYEPKWSPLTMEEVFYLATKSGGRFFDRVGSLEPGYRFNALVVEDKEAEEFAMTPMETLERFCYMGDDRNIVMRYSMGKELKI